MDLQKSMGFEADDVALSFTKHLFSKQENKDKNMVFSPFSLNAALSILAAGSQGRTLDELLSYLRFDSVDHLTTFFSQTISAVLSGDAAAPAHSLSFANGMWADESLSLTHSFKQLVATHYKATLASLDFKNKGDQVCCEVNSWVEKETNGLFTELLPPGSVSKDTRLIFANALHFKGLWEHKFDSTHHATFHLLNGTSVKVPLMSNFEDQFIRVLDGFKILRLSYKQGADKKRRFSMYILLPDAKEGLPSLIEKMASESGFLEGKLPQRKVKVGVFRIPKFNISFTFEASDVLKELGVVLPFSERDADFTKMVEVNSPLDELHVDSISHKAFIKVGEEGTEAATVTTVRMRGGGAWPEDIIHFEADHPFLFLIREDFTGTILFAGQVLNPLDGADGATTPVKEDLERRNWFRPVGNAEKPKKKSSDFESEKNGEQEDGDNVDKAEVPSKRKRSSKT